MYTFYTANLWFITYVYMHLAAFSCIVSGIAASTLWPRRLARRTRWQTSCWRWVGQGNWVSCCCSIIIIIIIIYYAEAAKHKRHTYYTLKKKAIHKIKQYTQYNIYTIAAKMVPEIFFDQTQKRDWADCRLYISQVCQWYCFTAVSNCMKSQIVTVEHF